MLLDIACITCNQSSLLLSVSTYSDSYTCPRVQEASLFLTSDETYSDSAFGLKRRRATCEEMARAEDVTGNSTPAFPNEMAHLSSPAGPGPPTF